MKRAFLAAACLACSSFFLTTGCDQKPAGPNATPAAPAKPAAPDAPAAAPAPAVATETKPDVAPAAEKPAEPANATPTETPAALPAGADTSSATAEHKPIEQPVEAAHATEPAAAAPAAAPAEPPAPAASDAAPAAAAEGLAGQWQGALACSSQQTVKANSQATPKSNSIKESHTFELLCDPTGKPVACTVLGFGNAPNAKVTLTEAGTTQTVAQKLPTGELDLQITTDVLTYTADSAEVALNIILTLNGDKLAQNGTGTQVVKVKLVDGKLQTQIQTDYNVTSSVMNMGIEIESGESIQGQGELTR